MDLAELPDRSDQGVVAPKNLLRNGVGARGQDWPLLHSGVMDSAPPHDGTPAPAARRRRNRPPEVSLSADVYARLRAVSLQERLTHHSRARSFGEIVLDAVEAHADRLATAWTTPAPPTTGGGLFVRPAAGAVPRRRRHASPPVTVPLAGIDPTNAGLLDDYAAQWGAGTRAALVEQALRYEFDLGLGEQQLSTGEGDA